MSEGEKKDGKFMLGFFLGGLIGALIIMFLGTKEGKRAGKQLGKKGRKLLDDLQAAIDELEDKERDIVASSEALKEHVTERITEHKEKLTTETAAKLDTALTHIEQLQERGRQTTANLRKKLFKNIPKK